MKKQIYTLDENNNIIPCSLEEWGKLYNTKEGRLRRDVSYDEINGYQVSTVFLGIDHNYAFKNNPKHKPVLFETMVFDKMCNDIYMERHSTWGEAEEGHKKAVEWVKRGCREDELD